jgi:hypothetical protein
MADVTNTVTQRIVIPKIQGAPQLKDLASESRKAAQATAQIGKEAGAIDTSLKRMGKSGKDAFRDVAQGATQARQSVKQLGDEAERTSKKLGGLSGRDMKKLAKATGMGGAFGVGRLAMAGGGIGLGVMAAADLGHLGLNAMYNQKFGQGPLQKEDAGMLMGTVGSIVDTFSGRKYREAAQDKAIEEIIKRGDRYKRQNDAAVAMEDRFRASYLPTKGLGTPLDQMKAQFANLSEEQFAIGNRFRRGQGNINAAASNIEEAKATYNKSSGEERAAAFRDMVRYQQELVRLNADQIRDGEKLIQIEEKRRDLKMRLLQQTQEEVRGKALQFADMNPMERMQAVELGRKLNKGEKLSVDEMEQAKDMPILRDLVNKQKIQQAVEMGGPGGFNEFLKAAGNQQERAIAERAQQKGLTVDAILRIDETELLETFRKALEPLQAQIKAATIRAENANENMEKLNKRREADRGALVER